MKFIHTADWQIGREFSHVYDKADALRQARFDTVKQILAIAEKERAEFVLVTGNTLADNRISRSTIEELAAVLQRSTVPIIIVPGEMDPLTQDNPFLHLKELWGDKVSIVQNESMINLPKEGTLYAVPVRSRSPQSAQAIEKLPIAPSDEDDGIRVGAAIIPSSTSAKDDKSTRPVAIDQDVDYLALGGFPEHDIVDDATHYAGTPEPFDFGQHNCGKILIVQIDEPEELPKIKEVNVKSHEWHLVEKQIKSSADMKKLLAEVSKLETPRSLLRVAVSGSGSQQDLLALESIEAEDFFHLEIDNSLSLKVSGSHYRHPLLQEMQELITTQASGNESDQQSARTALARLSILAHTAGFKDAEG